ncbi:hypothetical protein KAZ82_01640 [Candidatus Babeliales bacterium]|nr:hypothetical protein [Candidatus Babeliales bacterium]
MQIIKNLAFMFIFVNALTVHSHDSRLKCIDAGYGVPEQNPVMLEFDLGDQRMFNIQQDGDDCFTLIKELLVSCAYMTQEAVQQPYIMIRHLLVHSKME